VVHAHSLGGLVALRACPPEAEAMVLTGPVTAPLDQPWEEILSRVQVDELAAIGTTAVLDDGPSTRDVLVISTQTLADFTGVDQAALFAGVACPVLIIHGGALVDGEEHPLLTRSRVGLPGLPAGSRVEVVPGAEHAMLGESDEVARRALAWLAEVGPR
jgi:alpha-beta hydrolase superfamily lysophospholipase